MLKPFSMLFALLLCGFSALAQQGQAPAKAEPAAPEAMPLEAARQANPVKPTPESLAEGKKWYGFDCAMCHGKDGDGKGEVGKDMKGKVSDFTLAATLKDRSDGELFYIIKNGKGEMRGEGNRLKPTELWNLVNYIRSFAKKTAPPEEKAPK
jgi:mono/diheme cytochrome c family protein